MYKGKVQREWYRKDKMMEKAYQKYCDFGDERTSG